MKKTLFFLLISISALGQSTLILPQSATSIVAGHILKTNSDVQGYNHTNGIIGVGTFVSTKAYIQTHTLNSLHFAVANGSPAVTVSYSATPSLNKNLGIGTETPQEKLHVVGNILTSSLAGTGTRGMYANANGTISPQENIAFHSNNAGFGTISNTTYTTLVFQTEDYDLGNNYNNATGIFTAPVNGIYHFDGNVTWTTTFSSSGFFYLELYFAGSYYSTSLASATSGSPTKNSVSADLKLNAGQEVQMRVYQNTGASQNLNGTNYLSGFNGRLVIRL